MLPILPCPKNLLPYRHPERSRPEGGVAEGPILVDAPTEKVHYASLREAPVGMTARHGLLHPMKQETYRRPTAGDHPPNLSPDQKSTTGRAPTKPAIALPHSLSEIAGPL
jgi:hypothetical protein